MTRHSKSTHLRKSLSKEESNKNQPALYLPRQAKMCIRRMQGQRRPRSYCADAQSDQGLRCPLPESLATTECVNGEQSLGDVNPDSLRMLESAFSLNAAHIKSVLGQEN